MDIKKLFNDIGGFLHDKSSLQINGLSHHTGKKTFTDGEAIIGTEWQLTGSASGYYVYNDQSANTLTPYAGVDFLPTESNMSALQDEYLSS